MRSSQWAQKHVINRCSSVTYARWKTDSKVDQPEQRTEHSECYSNTVHICESVLHYAVTLWKNAQVFTRPNILRNTSKSLKQKSHTEPKTLLVKFSVWIKAKAIKPELKSNGIDQLICQIVVLNILEKQGDSVNTFDRLEVVTTINWLNT
jgi:hypothetical protein